MRYVKAFVCVATLFFLGGCANQVCKPEAGVVMQGTDTAIVGIYLDENGYPQTRIDKVTVYPGQKILFAGPDQFDILFKDQKSPIDKLEIRSSKSVVIIEIPKDIFERDSRASKTAATSNDQDELIYSYGIRVAGRVTDPTIHVIRR